MGKGLQILRIMAGIAVTIIIAVLAFFLPKWLFKVYDNRVYGKQEQVELEMTSYKKTGSLEEQLRSLALCSQKDGFSISAVCMEEGAAALSDEEVTQIVSQEVQQLFDLELAEVNLQQQDAVLVKRELYTAYITNPLNSTYGVRDAITFWKLHYQWNVDGQTYELEAIVDMEYHKLYDIKIYGDLYADIYSGYVSLPLKKKKSYWSGEDRWCFIDGITSYYSLNEKSYLINVYDVTTEYIGKELVDDDLQAAAGNPSYLEDTDSTSADVGIKTVEYPNRMIGSVEFIQDTEKGNTVELYVIKEYGMDGEQGYVHIGINGLQELLQLQD